jgi:hypothetical protein
MSSLLLITSRINPALKGEKMTTKILVKFLEKPITFPDGDKLVSAIPTINGDVINAFQEVVEVGKPRQQQLKDLGIKPGQKFLVIKSDVDSRMKNSLTYRARSLGDEIMELKEFKRYINEKKECAGCPVLTHVLFRHVDECANCEHGANIVSKFSIDKNLDAQVYPLK